MEYNPPNPFSRVQYIQRSDTDPPFNYWINMDNTSECWRKQLTAEEAAYVVWGWLPDATYAGPRRIGNLTSDLWVIDTADHMHRELAVLAADSNTASFSVVVYDGWTQKATGDTHASFVRKFMPELIDPSVFDVPEACAEPMETPLPF